MHRVAGKGQSYDYDHPVRGRLLGRLPPPEVPYVRVTWYSTPNLGLVRQPSPPR